MLELPVKNELPVYAPVRSLVLYLTEDCNLRCTYCFVAKRPRRMSLETALRSVDMFLHRNLSGGLSELDLTFFGGEPFLELDLMEAVVDYARRRRPNLYKRIRVSATTNGTVIGPRVERLIRDSGMELLISFDGLPEASAERPLVGGGASYRRVVETLPRLLSWSARAAVRMTFHPRALNLLDNVRHALELGARSVVLAPVFEADWQGHEARLAQAYAELTEWFLAECRAGRRPGLEFTWLQLRKWHQAQSGAPRPGRPCPVGHSLLAVNPDGQVMPCHRFLNRPGDWLGSIHQAHLDAARRPYQQLEAVETPDCRSCPARPICAGGCRVVALEAGAPLTGVAPNYCLLTRAHTAMVRAIYETLHGERNRVLLGQLASPGRWGPLGEFACTSG